MKVQIVLCLLLSIGSLVGGLLMPEGSGRDMTLIFSGTMLGVFCTLIVIRTEARGIVAEDILKRIKED